jgi:hypothetical protein
MRQQSVLSEVTTMVETHTTIKKPKVRWRRVVLVPIVGIALLAIAHAIWGWQAQRALNARVNELAAAGGLMSAGDFDRQPAEYDRREDGAPDLLAAAAIIDDVGSERRAMDFLPTTMPIDPRAWPHLARARAWYEPALRRIERAQTKKFFQFDHHLVSPVMDTVRLSELNPLHDLANVILLAAVVEHHDGRDNLVVGRIEQLMFLADRCETAPAEVGHGVAKGIHASAAARIEQFAPELNIGAKNGDGQVSAEQVRKLIARLLDETTLAAGQAHAMQAERMTMLDLFRAMAKGEGRSSNSVVGYFGQPYFHANAQRAIDYMTQLSAAVGESNDWPTAAGKIGAIKPVENRFVFARAFTGSSPERRIKTHFQILTDRRLAATALAVRLYQLDHSGARPQRLEELVPTYLPSVPLDAMAAGSRRLSYLPRAEHPVLYSVGENGDDDAGSEAAMPKRYGELAEWDRLDRAFYLSSRPRDVLYVERPGEAAERARLAAESAAYPAGPALAWEPGEQPYVAPWEQAGTPAAATQPTSR